MAKILALELLEQRIRAARLRVEEHANNLDLARKMVEELLNMRSELERQHQKALAARRARKHQGQSKEGAPK